LNRRELGQKFARLATNAVLRSPRLWRFFRPLVRKQFDAIAASWDTMRDPTHLAPYEAALAAGMLAEARRNTPAELAERVRFVSGDASALPFEDTSFALVAHANMIPFLDELERVLAPGGQALFAFSLGPGTPIYVTPERLREELGRRGFSEFAEFAAGKGTALLARKEVRA